MTRYVVLGAGGIGRGIAAHLAEHGHRVVLASRSGAGEAPAGVETAAVDARDAEALTSLAAGAEAVVNAMNPPQYHQWARDWPPVATALLSAAERSGAGLLTVSNLYGYGPVHAPMTEQTPLAATGLKGRIRAGMWADALAAHEEGRIRAAEIRPSDYFGAQARPQTSVLNDVVLRRARKGKGVWLPMGVADAPHSWSYLPDIASLAVAVLEQGGWGRAWHVPTEAPRTFAEVADDVSRLTGQPVVPVRRVPRAGKAALRVMPFMRELDETRHQFERPFVLDSRAAQQTFALTPTPWDEALATTLRDLP